MVDRTPPVTLRQSIEGSKRQVQNETAGEYVFVAVSPGLPDDQLAVLENGRETPLQHGEGLGLWLAYWITKRSNGDIAFSTSKRGGCLVTLELPAAVDSDDERDGQ